MRNAQTVFEAKQPIHYGFDKTAALSLISRVSIRVLLQAGAFFHPADRRTGEVVEKADTCGR